jgi:hypothetical protein
MNPFTPPTDSLYKFIAITGLVLVIFCLSFPIVQGENLGDQIESLKAEISMLKLERSFLATDIKQFEKDLDRKLTAEKANLTEEAKRRHVEVADLLKTRPKSNSTIPKDIGALIVQRDSITKRVRDEQRKNVQVESKLARIDGLMVRAKVYRREADYGCGFGLWMMGVGFFLWYFKIQRHLDSQITNPILPPASPGTNSPVSPEA